MDILRVTLTVLEALLALNLLIFVHELGHFWAARWRGLKIDRFAIWFGKPIWKKKYNGVEYALGWIPAGGYVALPQMATMEAIEGKTDDGKEPLPNISAMDKIIVAFAGPLFSFLLAIAFAVVVWKVGKPAQLVDNSTVIGWVDPKGPAARAGLQAGDKVIEIDGHKVNSFGGTTQDSIMWRIVTSEGTNIAFKYVRDGKEAMAYAEPYRRKTKWYERKSLRQVLIASASPSRIFEVASNSPAALAGLRGGDEIVALDGTNIYSPNSIFHLQTQMTNGIVPVRFTVKRGEEQLDFTITAVKPAKPEDAKPSFGIVSIIGNTNEALVYPLPMEQIKTSALQIFATINTVISRKSDVGVQQIGGAVMIIRVYKNFFDAENGWRMVLWFSVLLNVNLAMLNMLPLPVLDGGHITLALIEAARRRPVGPKLLNYIQSGFAAVLIMFMLYIAFFDIVDWVRSWRQERRESQPIVFAPR